MPSSSTPKKQALTTHPLRTGCSQAPPRLGEHLGLGPDARSEVGPWRPHLNLQWIESASAVDLSQDKHNWEVFWHVCMYVRTYVRM